MSLYSLVVISLFLENVAYSYDTLKCKNDDGEPVDWFFMISTPDDAYYFITSETIDKGWQRSNEILTSSDSMLGKTLSPHYECEPWQKKHAELFYNNCKPGNKCQCNHRRHSLGKGVVMVDRETGFWLVHSMPQFPFLSTYKFSDDRDKVGQSFMCITVRAEQVRTIENQLNFGQVHVYHQYTPNNGHVTFNYLKSSILNYEELVSAAEEIQSFAGQPFTSYVRITEESYIDCMGDYFGNLYIRTKMSNDRRNYAYCNKNRHFYNVLTITLPTCEISAQRYLGTIRSTLTMEDDSNWAISSDDEQNTWVCMNDSSCNSKCPGGSLCLNHPRFWSHFRNLFSDVDVYMHICNNPNK